MQTEMRRAIGKRLREARLRAGLTQQDVALDFLRSRQAVSSWEAGKTLPTLLEFRELATLYGVSTDMLLYQVADATEEGRGLLLRMAESRAECPDPA